MLISVSDQINHITTLIAWLRANNPGIDNLPEGWKPGDSVINSLPLSEIRIYKNLGITISDPNNSNTKSSALFEAMERVSIDIWGIGREENDDEKPKLLIEGLHILLKKNFQNIIILLKKEYPNFKEFDDSSEIFKMIGDKWKTIKRKLTVKTLTQTKRKSPIDKTRTVSKPLVVKRRIISKRRKGCSKY
ncbi:7279_t:CDS:2, partial [Gigaspora margarita]